MIKTIENSNINVRPFVVYKTWNLTDQTEGISVDEGLQLENEVFDESTSEVNTSGRYKKMVYHQMNQMFYQFASNPLFRFGGVSNHSEEIRVLQDKLTVVSIPQRYFGERIRPGTVSILDSGGGINKTLVDDGNGNLYDFATSSEYVGNVFYQQGLITCTHTGSYYSSSFLGTGVTGFTVTFDSTSTLYENEILCTVKEGEFNVSTNPTALQMSATGSSLDIIRGEFNQYEYSSSIDPTGSYLTPYATTIGLYDDSLNLIAVAKLAKPVKLIPDYPTNFLIRFDT